MPRGTSSSVTGEIRRSIRSRNRRFPIVSVRDSLNVGSGRPKREDFMIARRLAQLTHLWRTIMLAALA
ncbi:MAG TPA: hypothetical protein VKA15_23130, partial [Isosphaeraceae bacterium]|nr:hypothetical protein [Isosphaeraceae bacterium]